MSKPADLIPELQGRFPIRVELDSLTQRDFVKILTQPQNALIKQYQEMMNTEQVKLAFSDGAIDVIAEYATRANETVENIGARRLHTILEKLLEEVLFEGPELAGTSVTIDEAYVRKSLDEIVAREDSSRYIL